MLISRSKCSEKRSLIFKDRFNWSAIVEGWGMKLIGSVIFHIFSNTLAILAADYFIAGFAWNGNFLELLIVAFVFTLINVFLKPIIKLFLGPFIVLTFGFFAIIINAVILYILDLWSPLLTIEGISFIIWISYYFFLVSIVLYLKRRRRKEKWNGRFS